MEKDFLKEEEEEEEKSKDSEEEDNEPGVLITGARLDRALRLASWVEEEHSWLEGLLCAEDWGDFRDIECGGQVG